MNLLIFAATIVALVLAWRRRDAAPAVVLWPAVFGFGFHTAVTHNIPRYNAPMLPVLWAVTAWVCYAAGRRCCKRWQAARASATAAEEATAAQARG